MPHNVVTFGEIMLRLSPPGFERFFQSPVAVGDIRRRRSQRRGQPRALRADSRYVTRLPKHAIGEPALRALRAEGIDTTHVVRGGDRVGIYFAETGASQRASHGRLRPRALRDQRDWTRRGALGRRDAGRLVVSRHRHHAGARRQRRRRLARAIAAAKRAGARVSVDLNYRKKLWTEAQAQATMRPLMRDVDVVIANEEDLQAVLGVPVAGADVTGGALDVAGYRAAAERVTREFGPAHGRDYPAREPVGERQRLERRAVGCEDEDDASEPALCRPAGRSHRRRRQLRGGPDLRDAGRAPARCGAAVRGGGERAQTDDPRRLQSRHRG